jgi:hypothetical protein
VSDEVDRGDAPGSQHVIAGVESLRGYGGVLVADLRDAADPESRGAQESGCLGRVPIEQRAKGSREIPRRINLRGH